MPATALENAPKYPPFTDKYEVERILGRGGMGTVFEARHARLGHRVAIKVLGSELRAHPELVKRFEREARAASALTSPHAVRVHDIDQTEDGTPFFVMELLDGRDLSNIIEHDGPQPWARSIRWIVEACDAISEAHRLGIIHRDIKPSNLLLCDAGSIKVLDFGIAKHLLPQKGDAALTTGLVPLGTPAYMSPEQVRCARDVDARTDIWSLGVTLYELVTGRPPFDHDVPQACIAAIVADPVPDPRCFAEIPDELAHVINKALAKDPAGRYQTVDELVLALATFIESEPQSERTPSWKVITGARRMMAKSNPTMSDEDVVLELRPDRDVSGVEPTELASAPTAAASDPVAVSSPQTGPLAREMTPAPMITRATIPPRGRRIRSVLAMAAAAALGLVALVVTPRLGDPASARSRVATTTLEPSTPVSVTAAPSAVLETAPAEAQEPMPVAPEKKPEPVAPVVIAEKPLAPVAASATPAVAKPHASSSRVRYIGSDRPVHGGITGPGF